MITRYRFGTMIPTDSVVTELPISEGSPAYLSREDGGWSYTLAETDQVFGLGETLRGMNKRGWKYRSHCADDPIHTEDKVSLYGAHNFLIVLGREERPTFGIFLDFGGDVSYDIGYTRYDRMTITPAEENYDLYLIQGGSAKEICAQLRQLTGRSYIPPRWGFGFGQSRWGYRNEEDIRAVAEGYRSRGIPLDAVYMDIDYMQDYADFTVNQERFPNLKALAEELKTDGIRLVPIIDAGIKNKEDDPTCREGLEKGYFCTKEDGTPFIGAVWPGQSYFADFLRPEVREWFGGKYQKLLDQGIEGFWNDMNEPAIFYTPEKLERHMEEIASMRGRNLGIDEFFRLKDLVLTLSNAQEDYESFYHQAGDQRVRHDRIHNLYGYHMTRAASEAFQKLRPGQRTLMFSRASLIGAHRYGGIWLGDNCAWWSHLALNVQQMAGVQMCGFLFSGADLCGFGCDTTPELAMRWLEFGIFTPLMRNHAAMGTRDQEFYRFIDQMPGMGRMLKLRYALLPYLYSEFVKAALEDGMYFRPLVFDYPEDDRAGRVEDQLMLGEGIMVAPVVTPNAVGRYVYLPEKMKLMRLRSAEDYDVEILEKGDHYVPCRLEEVLLFLRPGAVVPVAEPADCTQRIDPERLTLWHYLPEGQGSYRLYWDDGVTEDYQASEHWRTLRAEP